MARAQPDVRVPAAQSRPTTRRNALIALPLLCSASQVWSQITKAGPARRIGLLAAGNPADVAEFERSFLSALRKAGWAEGDNLVLIRAYPDAAGLAQGAEHLVGQRVGRSGRGTAWFRDRFHTIGRTQSIDASRRQRGRAEFERRWACNR